MHPLLIGCMGANNNDDNINAFMLHHKRINPNQLGPTDDDNNINFLHNNDNY